MGSKEYTFPNLEIDNFNEREKEKIETDIENEFKSALIGIKKLPASSKKVCFLLTLTIILFLKKLKLLLQVK